MGRKYARIFVLGHDLFLVAHSFPRATLSENCSLLGTDNVCGQISQHIFALLFIYVHNYSVSFIVIVVVVRVNKQKNNCMPPTCTKKVGLGIYSTQIWPSEHDIIAISGQ